MYSTFERFSHLLFSGPDTASLKTINAFGLRYYYAENVIVEGFISEVDFSLGTQLLQPDRNPSQLIIDDGHCSISSPLYVMDGTGVIAFHEGVWMRFVQLYELPDYIPEILNFPESDEFIYGNKKLYGGDQTYYEISVKAIQREVAMSVEVYETGTPESNAYAWINALMKSYTAFPDNNVMSIEEWVVDDLVINSQSTNSCVEFSVMISVKPSLSPIESNPFWMAGNTRQCIDKDASWGQFSRVYKIEVRSNGCMGLVS
jgi:hypothetical protein